MHHWSKSSTGNNGFSALPFKLPRGDPDKKPELVAPAKDVPVLNTQGTWSSSSGTSAATVYVTGPSLCCLKHNHSWQAMALQGKFQPLMKSKIGLCNLFSQKKDRPTMMTIMDTDCSISMPFCSWLMSNLPLEKRYDCSPKGVQKLCDRMVEFVESIQSRH